MAVLADPEELEVDASGVLDQPLIVRDLRAEVCGHAVGHMGIVAPDVGAIEQSLVHVMTIRLGVVRRYADIFVEVEAVAAREVHPKGREPVIERLHHSTRGQTQHEMRLGAHARADQLGDERRGGVRVRSNDDFHGSSTPTSRENRIQTVPGRDETNFVEHVVKLPFAPTSETIQRREGEARRVRALSAHQLRASAHVVHHPGGKATL